MQAYRNINHTFIYTFLFKKRVKGSIDYQVHLHKTRYQRTGYRSPGISDNHSPRPARGRLGLLKWQPCFHIYNNSWVPTKASPDSYPQTDSCIPRLQVGGSEQSSWRRYCDRTITDLVDSGVIYGYLQRWLVDDRKENRHRVDWSPMNPPVPPDPTIADLQLMSGQQAAINKQRLTTGTTCLR